MSNESCRFCQLSPLCQAALDRNGTISWLHPVWFRFSCALNAAYRHEGLFFEYYICGSKVPKSLGWTLIYIRLGGHTGTRLRWRNRETATGVARGHIRTVGCPGLNAVIAKRAAGLTPMAWLSRQTQTRTIPRQPMHTGGRIRPSFARAHREEGI